MDGFKSGRLTPTQMRRISDHAPATIRQRCGKVLNGVERINAAQFDLRYPLSTQQGACLRLDYMARSRRQCSAPRSPRASTIDCARSASYVELHIIGEMLSLQKCEADAKDPVVTGQARERTQHLCNAWQLFRRDSTQPITSALVLGECLACRCCELFCRCGKGLPVDSSAR